MAAKTEHGAHDKVGNGSKNRNNGNGSVVVQADSSCCKNYHENGHRSTVLSLQRRKAEEATTEEDAASTSAPATNELLRTNGRKLAECVLVLSLPLRRAFNENNDRSCRVALLAVATTVIYGLSYALLVRYQEFLQPPLSKWKVENDSDSDSNSDSNVKRKHKHKRDDWKENEASLNSASAWRSRILSIANALILLVGSAFSFAEWNSRYNPESEGWVRSLPLSCDDDETGTATVCSCFTSHAITFTYLFVGYLQWDLCWIVWHRDTHPDLGSIIHHGLFIAMASCICDGTMIYFRKPVAWLTLTELSTPFLNLRWYLAATDQKDTKLYCLMSLLFAGTFLSTRTVGYGLGLADVWFSQQFWTGVPRLRGVVAGLHLVYLLNLVWSYKVGSALVRAFVGNKTASTKTIATTKQE